MVSFSGGMVQMSIVLHLGHHFFVKIFIRFGEKERRNGGKRAKYLRNPEELTFLKSKINLSRHPGLTALHLRRTNT